MPSLCDDDEAVLYIIAHVKICERLITSLGSLLHAFPPADNCFGYLRGHCIDYFCSSILYPIINKAILLLVYVTCSVSVKFHVIY